MIYFDPEEVRWMRRVAGERHATVASVVRQAVARLRKEFEDTPS